MTWMKQIRKALCHQGSDTFNQLSGLDIPKVFYFSFDGAADFNARKALALDPTIANLSGRENSDLHVGNFNGGRHILKHILENNRHHLFESRYYASSGLQRTEGYDRAFKCARHIDEYLDVIEGIDLTDYKKPLMVTIGYSNGGIDSLKLQNEMPEKLDRPVDLVLTIDPIEKAHKYHAGQTWTYAGERNPRTGIYLNFFQKVDYMSLGTNISLPREKKLYLGFKFKGKLVLDADLNHEYTLDNNITFKVFNGAYAHVNIVKSYSTWKTFQCSLDQLLYNQKPEETQSCQDDLVLTQR